MSGGPLPPPMIHNKRHVPTGSYPNDRRAQQHQQHQHQHQQQQQQQQQQPPLHEHPPNNDSNNNNNNTNTHNNHSNNNNGYNNRGWKRPCMFSFNEYLILIFLIKGKNLMAPHPHQQHLKYVKFQLNLILFQN
jgi:hypothetical protein